MAAYRFKQYGVTDAQLEAMVLVQCGKCAICTEPLEPPHIDHDHVTGRIRGLLCGKCNKALGLVGDQPAMLRVAAEYLEVVACMS